MENLIINKCERCDGELILCPANYPWNEQFWICVECESTYVFKDGEKKMTKDYTLSELKICIKEAIKESFEEIDEFKTKLLYEEARSGMIACSQLSNEITKSL